MAAELHSCALSLAFLPDMSDHVRVNNVELKRNEKKPGMCVIHVLYYKFPIRNKTQFFSTSYLSPPTLPLLLTLPILVSVYIS